jgi:hypothetical protein
MKRSLVAVIVLLLAVCWVGPVSAQSPFDRQDTNGDGKLSKSEFRGPAPAFKRMDKDNDGYISRSEAEGTRLAGKGRGKGRQQPALTEPSRDLVYVDTHNHLVGRKTGGKMNLERQAGFALEAMNASGVKLNLILPMPQHADQGIGLFYEDLLPVLEAHPGRFAALGGGGTLNVMIQQAVEAGTVTKKMEREFDRRAEELVKAGAVGFGEMTAEHFSMDDHHPYETAPPDHPLFLRLADLAAEYGMPIDLHMEAVSEPMAMPKMFSVPPNPAKLTPNIEGFERLLAHNRKAKIIWVHLGWCNTGHRTVALTRELMADHPNLYISLRVAAGKKKKKVVNDTFPFDSESKLRKEWLALIESYPDRFIIGSDEIVRASNDHVSSGSMAATVSLLDQLPDDLKTRIGSENAYAIYRLKR